MKNDWNESDWKAAYEYALARMANQLVGQAKEQSYADSDWKIFAAAFAAAWGVLLLREDILQIPTFQEFKDEVLRLLNESDL